MTSSAVAQLTAVLWIIAAVVGLYFWARNRVVARGDLAAAQMLGADQEHLRFARFEVKLTNVFLQSEVLFIALGVMSTLRTFYPEWNGAIRWIIAAGLIGFSARLSVLASQWLTVHRQLIEQARQLIGATGATGETGATGATGATGLVGATGHTGLTGAAGTIGARGAAGASGETGAIGARGDAGEAGTPGAAGSVGSTGSTGATGREPSLDEITDAVRRAIMPALEQYMAEHPERRS